MTGNFVNRADNRWSFAPEAELHRIPQQGLFFELTRFESLQGAYSKLNEILSMDYSTERLELALPGDEVSGFLQQLSKDLQAGIFPGEDLSPSLPAVSDVESRINLRTRIVQIAIANALESIFAVEPPANPVAWTSAAIGHGLWRVYTFTMEQGECYPNEQLVAATRLCVDDPPFVALLGKVLKGIHLRDATVPNPLTSVLTRIAFQNVDRVLQQANLLGRQGSYIHAMCMRFDRDVALLLDNDPQSDWLLPAVRKRLREALEEIKAGIDPEKTQVTDLARGEPLHFLDHEFRLVRNRDGTARVQSKPLVKASPPKSADKKPSRPSFKLPVLRWLRWSWSWSLKGPRRIYAIAFASMLWAVVLALVVLFPRSDAARLYPVHGQVFFNGKPAVGALVVFFPKEASSTQAQVASALVTQDGSYVLGTYQAKDGAMAGSYVVALWGARGMESDGLPTRYAGRHTTPLTADVQMGRTEVPLFQVQPESQ